MTAQERVNSFADDDLSDFGTSKHIEKKPDPKVVDEVAASAGFPSRQPAAENVELPLKKDRRRRTGRNNQLNLKVDSKALTDFYYLLDKLDVTQGEVFARAVAALKAQEDTK